MIKLWDCLKKLTDLLVQYKLLPLQTEKSHKEKKHNGWRSSSSIAASKNSKRLMDVPKFYGNAKDTLTARKFISGTTQKMWRVLPPPTFGSQWVHISHPQEIQNGQWWLEHKQEVVLAALWHQRNSLTQLLCTTWDETMTKIQVNCERINDTIDQSRCWNDKTFWLRIKQILSRNANELEVP